MGQIMTFKQKVAVITGAGSGIGRALALALAEQGCHLALSDINQLSLDETATFIRQSQKSNAAEIQIHTQAFDVGDEKAFLSFKESVLHVFTKVDFVFNNAGVSLVQPAPLLETEDLEWIMRINFWGIVYGTQAFLPEMIKKDSGTIINISSLFGLLGWPKNAAYCASKFAVRGFTEALRLDLFDTKVRLVTVHPGGVRTQIVENARVAQTIGQNTKTENAKSQLAKQFSKIARTTADQAAQEILNGLKKNKMRILVGKDAKILDFMQRLFPEKYVSLLARLTRVKI